MRKIIDQIGGEEIVFDALNSNLNWLKNSFSSNGNKGSSAYCNIWGRWSEAYPETTGYITRTLLRAYLLTGQEWCKNIALAQVQYFKEIQNEDGSFFQKDNNQKPVVFDTAQILLGLTEIYKTQKSTLCLQLIEASYNWLLNNVRDGNFTAYNYVEGYNPSYYSRVYWAMLEASSILNILPDEKILNGIQYVSNLQNANGSFKNCSLDNSPFALTHTIAYTIRGLWECGRILDDPRLIQQSEKCLDKIIVLGNNSKFLAGKYNQEWDGDKSFSCATGNAQLVVLAIKIDAQYYSGFIQKNLLQLLKVQKKSGHNKGAIPSSIPIWGKYQRCRYTNWTQKFYSDCLLELLSQK